MKLRRMAVIMILAALCVGCTPTGTYRSYAVGDAVSYGDAGWFVIEASPASSDTVLAISATLYDPLDGRPDGYTLFSPLVSYDQPADYDGSALAAYLDGIIAPALGIDGLRDQDGHRLTLPTLTQLQSLAAFTARTDAYGLTYWQAGRLDWLAAPYDGFWTMTPTPGDVGCTVCGESMIDCTTHVGWYMVKSDEDMMTITGVGDDCPHTVRVVARLAKDHLGG